MDIGADGMSASSGWYCPGCGQYHGPHVDTCPVEIYDKNPYRPPDPYKDVKKATCPKCGLKLEDIMMYVCSNNGCPTGLGGTYC